MNNKDEFFVGEYDTADEAAFAYNVAACVFHGPEAELNTGMNLTIDRMKEIEKEVLKRIKEYLEMPKNFEFGEFPELYGKPKNGFYVFQDEDGEFKIKDSDGNII